MSLKKCILPVLLVLSMVLPAFAYTGMMATQDDIARLKEDLIRGNVKIAVTRLDTIRRRYGNAPTVSDTERSVVYEYGDIRLDFGKNKIFRDWTMDTFKERVYTDDVQDLINDLQSDEIVGENITLGRIIQDYGQPTESHPTNEDGGLSVYYYGQVKMVFENVVSLSGWKGKNLVTSSAEDAE